MRKSDGVERRCKPGEVRRGEVEAENPDGVSIGRVGSKLRRETLRVPLRVAPPLLRIELCVSLLSSSIWFLAKFIYELLLGLLETTPSLSFSSPFLSLHFLEGCFIL